MAKKTIEIKKFKRRMISKLLVRVLIEFVVLLFIFILTFYILKYTVSRAKIWYIDEPLYLLLKFLDNNMDLLLFIFCLALISIIFVRAWLRILGYLEDILNATLKISNNSDSFIELPDPLNEIEIIMNQIKLDVKEKEQFAKEAEQRKNDLVVYLAHDLKTPLTSVIGYLSLLNDEKQISSELQDKYLSISLRKALRLEDLINEFFDITRFNLSSITLEYSSVNLKLMLEQIVFEFEPRFLQKNIECSLSVPPELQINCDADKMQRVFDNILTNAVNYSFANSKINIEVTSNENDIQICMTNEGNTIPEEKLNRLFEQFYRLDSSRASKTGGSGLGLAIAKQIVNLHHGTISAKSYHNHVTFELRLPKS